jgi:putative inorganic carbon (HCO3(-)) transporter
LTVEIQEAKERLAKRLHPEDRSVRGAFFWLSAFYVVYCTRPEDWIPGLKYLPLAKITGVFALLGLISSLGRTQRKLRDLPRESVYLLALISVFFISAIFSPVWKGGALRNALDFSKVLIVWVLTFLLVTDFARLKRIILIQSGSVAVISSVSIIAGSGQERLRGVLGGIYSNPNDLALAIVITLPFVLAFFLTARRIIARICWATTSLVMVFALLRTASRAGFISLIVSAAVCLWYFGIKGRRFYLIAVAAVATSIFLAVAGHTLFERIAAISGEVDTQEQGRAYGSYEERKQLMERAFEGIAHYPVLGLGARNFETYSGHWKEVHMTYLQIAVEGGIFAFALYLLFYARAFKNLKILRRRRDLDEDTMLFVGAMHGSMIAFAVGALFAPVAYQFFAYFSVAYISTLLAIVQEREPVPETSPTRRRPLLYSPLRLKPSARPVHERWR